MRVIKEEFAKYDKDDWVLLLQCILILMMVVVALYANAYIYFLSGYVSHQILHSEGLVK